jgi:chitinase
MTEKNNLTISLLASWLIAPWSLTANAVDCPAVSGAWNEGNHFSVNQYVTYQGNIYQALVSHTAWNGAGWTPEIGSLWRFVEADHCNDGDNPGNGGDDSGSGDQGTNDDGGPFNDMVVNLPGILEAENYDYRGFSDSTDGNSGGSYRHDSVDIEASTQHAYNVGWIDSGEWLQYQVNITQAGKYRMSSLVASLSNGGQYTVSMGGQTLATQTVPVTNGWQNWRWIDSTITLPEGTHKIRFNMTRSGFNLNAMDFTFIGNDNTDDGDNGEDSNQPDVGTPAGFIYSPYKDITINMDWNTNVMSTMVYGNRQSMLSAMPDKLDVLTWAFATGECGSESWAGLRPDQVADANVQGFVDAGKYYILSTGGAAGSFTCGSDAGFMKFIATYYSKNLLGVDFDIEAGQSQQVIEDLVRRARHAQQTYPNMIFSFTIATLGGREAQNLGGAGIKVMQAIKSLGLQNYRINLMTMDYGSTTPVNCMIGADGSCDMGESAIRAAVSLHDYYGVPYNQIEVTPMIGGNDTIDETFKLADVDKLSSFAKQVGLAGIHFWSIDRDKDCAPGYASTICNSYGQAGTLGFTHRFIGQLGL